MTRVQQKQNVDEVVMLKRRRGTEKLKGKKGTDRQRGARGRKDALNLDPFPAGRPNSQPPRTEIPQGKSPRTLLCNYMNGCRREQIEKHSSCPVFDH
jgi:hypothetical protein